MNRLIIGALMASSLVGCASMTPEQCQSANWHDVGYQDGKDGNDPSIVDDYATDCLEANVVVNKSQWQQGFKQGTEVYCSADNGYKVGSEGRTYYNVCHDEQFLKNYQLGKKEYQRQQRLMSLDSQIADLDNQMEATSDTKKYNKLRNRRKDLAHERSQLLNPDINFNLKL